MKEELYLYGYRAFFIHTSMRFGGHASAFVVIQTLEFCGILLGLLLALFTQGKTLIHVAQENAHKPVLLNVFTDICFYTFLGIGCLKSQDQHAASKKNPFLSFF